jgi:hypothetical protein
MPTPDTNTTQPLPPLPELPYPDVIDPGRFGVAWGDVKVIAYAQAYARAALAAQPAAPEHPDDICEVCGCIRSEMVIPCGVRDCVASQPAAPEVAEPEEQLLRIMGEHDFTVPEAAFKELVHALSATSAQAERKPLSEEQIDEAWGASQAQGWRGFARAIERAHGIGAQPAAREE